MTEKPYIYIYIYIYCPLVGTGLPQVHSVYTGQNISRLPQGNPSHFLLKKEYVRNIYVRGLIKKLKIKSLPKNIKKLKYLEL